LLFDLQPKLQGEQAHSGLLLIMADQNNQNKHVVQHDQMSCAAASTDHGLSAHLCSMFAPRILLQQLAQTHCIPLHVICTLCHAIVGCMKHLYCGKVSQRVCLTGHMGKGHCICLQCPCCRPSSVSKLSLSSEQHAFAGWKLAKSRSRKLL